MTHHMSLDLHEKQSQSLKQSQRLMMSPQMQQAISLLQMPVMELSTMVDAELEHNPVLEYDDEESVDDTEVESKDIGESDASEDTEVDFDDKDFEIMCRLDEEFSDLFSESGSYRAKRTAEEEKLKGFMESSIRAEMTLFNFLMTQARQVFDDPEDIIFAEAIIGNLDDSGFLEIPLREISLLNEFDEKHLEGVLAKIQGFEPRGIASTSLRESLIAQLCFQGKEGTLAYSIVKEHYDDMLHNRIPLIRKSLGCTVQAVRDAIDNDIAKLDIHPGLAYSHQMVQYITPDLFIVQDDGRFSITINDDTLPTFRVNHKYLLMLKDENLPEDTRIYIQNKVTSGKWLLRNIHQRNETLFKIAQLLLHKQKDFFADFSGKLLPLTMKVIAEELDVHESTVARAVSNKYLSCLRGIVSLRSFFTNAYVTDDGDDVSSCTVKDMILDIVSKENKRKPHSDQAISKDLTARGITCARRTVAKYRHELNIGSASQRKDYR